MYCMEFDQVRWELLRRVLAEGPGMSLSRVAQKAGVSPSMLSEAYSKKRRKLQPAKRDGLIEAAADETGVDQTQLSAYLLRLPVHLSLEEHLQILLTLRECLRCQGWFSKDQMIVDLGLCRRCARAKQSPGVLDWEHKVRELMPKVPDPLIRTGYQAVSADSQNAIKHTLMAKAAGVEYSEWMQRWEAAGLPPKRAKAAKTGTGGQGSGEVQKRVCVRTYLGQRRGLVDRTPRRRRSFQRVNGLISIQGGSSSFLPSSLTAAGCW